MSRTTTGWTLGALVVLTCGGLVPAQQRILAHDEENEFASHVWSGYQDTWVENDGVHQSLSEEISGGKRSERTSRLAHDWFFDVPEAGEIQLLLRAARTPDRENFVFFASIDDGQSYEPLPEIYVQSSAMTSFEVTLPSIPAGGGTIRIRIEDEQSAEWASTADSVHVDYLALLVAPPGKPPAPEGLVTSGKSPSTIYVGWTDTHGEDGYYVERFEGVDWVQVGQTGVDGTLFPDEGLTPSTTYSYRVKAYNTAGTSDPSEEVTGTTRALGEFSSEYFSSHTPGGQGIAHDVDAAGRVRVAWQAGAELWYAERDPAAGTWHTEVVAPDVYGFGFDVAPDGTVGVAYVARVDYPYGDLFVVERQPGATVWDAPVLLQSDMVFVYSRGLSYDSQGRPAVSYVRLLRERDIREAEIHFAQRIGGVWRSKLVTDEYGVARPALAFDGNDRPVVAHEVLISLGKKWQYRRGVGVAHWIEDPGTGAFEDATWSQERIDPGEGNLTRVQLAVDPVSGAEAVAFSLWDDARQSDVVYVARRAAGSWGIEEAAIGYLGYSGTNLALDSSGVAYLAFYTSTSEVRLASDGTGAWTSELVDPYAAEASLHVSAAGSASIVHLAELFPGGPAGMFRSWR